MPEYNFTINATFTADTKQDAWDEWVEWLTNPGNLEDGTAVIEFSRSYADLAGHANEWFCNECSTYFDASLDSCPTCGAFVDYQQGVAHR